MLERERFALTQGQAELARALMLGSPAPAGFDASRLRLTASLLRSKRRREALQSFAPIVRGLSDRAKALFDEYVRRFPTPHRGGPSADGHRFLKDLLHRDDLDSSALTPILLLAALQTIDSRGSLRRRRFGVAVAHAENRRFVAISLFGRAIVGALPRPF